MAFQERELEIGGTDFVTERRLARLHRGSRFLICHADSVARGADYVNQVIMGQLFDIIIVV